MSFTSGQVARRIGVSTSALVLWEERGLVKPQRTPGGWRVYEENDVTKLEEIRRRDRKEPEPLRVKPKVSKPSRRN